MNYIRHLNAVMEKFAEDDCLNPTHVSMYLALFQMWNLNRFNNPISIARTEMMRISKIGSRTTYLKCLKDLSTYGYIEYHPSRNPLKGSKVRMFNFYTSTEQEQGQEMSNKPTSPGQVVGPSINSSKQTKQNRLNSSVSQNKNYDEPL